MSVQSALIQARVNEAIEGARLEVITELVADLSVFYVAAETESVEEIRKGLKQLLSKNQQARLDVSEKLRKASHLAEDVAQRFREEIEAQEKSEVQEEAG